MRDPGLTRPLFTFFTLITLLLPAMAGAAPATDPSRVVILPIEAYAAGDLSYLQEGVRTMLASRLAANAGVQVINRSTVDKATAGGGQPEVLREIGRQLQADYLITGSITSLGTAMSIDILVTPISGGDSQPDNFYATADGDAEVIQAVNLLTWDIAETIFGRKRPEAAAPRNQAAISDPAPPAAGMSRHPEKAFLSPATDAAIPAADSPYVRPATTTAATAGFIKSPTFDLSMKAMDVGDINGDGADEIVMAGRKEIRIYRDNHGRFSEVTTIPINSSYPVHAINVADLNNNGVAEIYVSAADHETPHSSGLEWNGSSFVPLFEKARWFIRVMDLPGQGQILVGQKAAVNAPVRPGIFRLERQGDELQQEERIALPEFINLFDFTMADLDGDGSYETIGISQDDILYVMSGNKLLWQSDDHYGGVTRYIGGMEGPGTTPGNETDSSEPIGREDQGKRIYIPSRIITTDINGDGRPDIVVNKNLSTASRIFERYRSYPSGEMHALTWNGLGLTELWHTRKIDGYIADYQLAGQQLLVGIGLRGGWMNAMGDGDSAVLVFPLER